MFKRVPPKVCLYFF